MCIGNMFQLSHGEVKKVMKNSYGKKKKIDGNKT
nr:MAG TPA: hypothetical protein [Caudoviricetes sp.]